MYNNIVCYSCAKDNKIEEQKIKSESKSERSN